MKAPLAHPQDDDLILDIEQGEMQLDAAKQQSERAQAEQRRRQRQLNALPWGEKVKRYLIAGIEHIIPKGIDHILFVLGLFFSTLLLKRLVWQITAFTLAHTATLALAALGLVAIPGSIVEPLIALSIAYVAVENLRSSEPSRFRPVLVFLFGLLHGLGFASVLQDYGLPKNALVTALLSFNVGVEIGQILVLVFAFALVFLWRDKIDYRRYIQIPVSLIIGFIGLYWFVERIYSTLA